MDVGRQHAAQLRQDLPDLLHRLHNVRARLTADIQQHGWLAIGPGSQLVVLDAIDHIRYIGQTHGRIGRTAVRNDRALVLGGSGQLVIGADGVGLRCTVQRALGRVDVRLGQRIAHVLHGQAEVGQLRRIHLDAHGRPYIAGDRDQAHTLHL